MQWDISHLLDQWEYSSGQVVVRKFTGKDGVEKIQLRIDLGILQMNLEGRPDGKRPFGHESLLEHYVAVLERHRQSHGGKEDEFRLRTKDCGKLQQEAIQYHHRYHCRFQLEDYQGVIGDTERNLEVFDFVAHYAESEEASWALQQFRPQVLLMRTRAKGMITYESKDYVKTIGIIEEGLEEIRDFYRVLGRHDLMEQSMEIQALEAWLPEVHKKRPLTERERLESALADALQKEDYEKAAQVRDAIRNLKSSS